MVRAATRRAATASPPFSAVVSAMVATNTGSPAALLALDAETLLSRLCRQLRQHGAAEITVLTRPEWRSHVAEAVAGPHVVGVSSLADALRCVAACAGAARSPLVVAHGEIITHDAVLTGLICDPRLASGIVTTSRALPGEYTLGMRSQRGRIVAAESAYHAIERPTGAVLGLLKVAEADRSALADAGVELAELRSAELPPPWRDELAAKVQRWGEAYFRKHASTAALVAELERVEGSAKWLPDPASIRAQVEAGFASAVLHRAYVTADDIVSLLVTGMVRNQRVLTLSHLRELYWSRPLSQPRAAEAAQALAAIDEDRILLRSAVKGADGFFTTFLVSPYSKYIARWCAGRSLTPNQVTTFSMVVGIAAASAFAVGSRAGLVVGALLLQAAFTLDCVDGQLARYTRQFSRMGAWLDSVFDRGKEYAVFVGLAVGAVRAGTGSGIWLLAAAALALQTFRHTVDFSYAATQHVQMTKAEHAPLREPRDLDDAQAHDPTARVATPSLLVRVGRAGIAASRSFERRRWMKWAKRILVLPIGERFALISLTAALFSPRVTFIALLAWGTLAAIYTVLGRTLRSFA